jgi:predicted RNA-binding Zn-ribbon protein involved in translation (DUF1610 family)
MADVINQVCLNGHKLDPSKGAKDICPKCGEAVVSGCQSCGAEIYLRWDYRPETSGYYSQYYTGAVAGRDFCPKCLIAYEWVRRWMFRPARVENLFVSLSTYERQLIRFFPDAPSPTEDGLTWEDINSRHVVNRFINWFFGPRYGNVGIEDVRHPKHCEWGLFDISCCGFISCKRKLALLELNRQRTQEEFWRGLTGQQFEIEFARLLQRIGYSVEHIGGPGDLGVDLSFNTRRGRVVVQCKAHAAAIGPGAVRDLYGALLHAGATEAWLVSLAGFSIAAREFAAGKPIRLLTISEFLRDAMSTDDPPKPFGKGRITRSRR